MLMRAQSAVDRWVSRLVLTKHGVRVADRVPEILADVYDALLTRFSDGEITSHQTDASQALRVAGSAGVKGSGARRFLSGGIYDAGSHI